MCFHYINAVASSLDLTWIAVVTYLYYGDLSAISRHVQCGILEAMFQQVLICSPSTLLNLAFPVNRSANEPADPCILSEIAQLVLFSWFVGTDSGCSKEYTSGFKQVCLCSLILSRAFCYFLNAFFLNCGVICVRAVSCIYARPSSRVSLPASQSRHLWLRLKFFSAAIQVSERCSRMTRRDLAYYVVVRPRN